MDNDEVVKLVSRPGGGDCGLRLMTRLMMFQLCKYFSYVFLLVTPDLENNIIISQEEL